MRSLRSAVISTTLVVVPVAVLAAVAGPAAAHTHPTNVELIAPAVVQVETYVEVNISLIEHNRKGAHIGLLQQRYSPKLASGSGFDVDPDGGVVTSREVIDVDLRRAEIYAVNQIFHERYGDVAPLPADPFAMQSINGGDPADQIPGRLQQCYRPNATDMTGGCVVFSRRVIKVLPFVTSQQQFGNLPATVVTPDEGQPGDVVVLKVGASSMPTARLATGVQSAPFTVLGFSTTPSNEQSLRKLEGHFIKDGSTELKRDPEYNGLVTGMGTGLAGGPVVGERGDVVGFLIRRPGAAPTDLTLVEPAAIRAALDTAKITAHSGPTDGAYESALHNYKNQLYAAAIPSLSQTLKLYPGHALATEALAQANRKRGTADDLTGRPAQATPGQGVDKPDFRRTVLPLVVAGAALILLAVAIVLLLRRRRSTTAVPADPAGGPPPVVVPAPRQPSSASPGLGAMRRQATVLRPRTVGAGPSSPPPPATECPVCGAPVVAAQTFCGECGHRLG